MKKNKKLVVLLLIIMMLTTGCTKRFSDEKTKKSYTKNILCQPTYKTTREIYERNNIKLDKLEKCKELTIQANGYEGLWTNIFVKPLAWLIVKLGNLVKNYGLSIILLGIALRLILLPSTLKTAKMSENMGKAQKELNKLEKKYENKTDKEAMMAKSQEMMMIYKKYNINPLSSCLSTFIQIPILFAFLEAIYRVPIIFEGKLIFDLGKTPWEAITSGQYYYIIIVILIVLTTYYSFKNINTQTMDQSQAKQMNSMNIFMVVFIAFASFGLPTAIAMYWVASSGFAVVQGLITKILNNKKNK